MIVQVHASTCKDATWLRPAGRIRGGCQDDEVCKWSSWRIINL